MRTPADRKSTSHLGMVRVRSDDAKRWCLLVFRDAHNILSGKHRREELDTKTTVLADAGNTVYCSWFNNLSHADSAHRRQQDNGVPEKVSIAEFVRQCNDGKTLLLITVVILLSLCSSSFVTSPILMWDQRKC